MNKQIQLGDPSSNGLYVAFAPKPERIAAGARVTNCKRCSAIVGHWPRDSIGYEIVCLNCAKDVPAIARRLDELAKTHG